MSRYEKEHNTVNVSIVPFFPRMAKETVIRDTETGQEGRGSDWSSYGESDRKALEDLKGKE